MKNSNEMRALIKQRGTNQLDDLTLGLVNAMKYSHADILYPDFGDVKPGEGVEPEWFYDIYKGTNNFSELTAIHQYISQEALFDEVGELMMGIALVEMKHMDKLGDFILALKGEVTQEYDTKYVSYGKSAREAVQLGIESETNTIAEYNRILNKVQALPVNKITVIAFQLLSKLIADESLHLALFQQWLTDNPDAEK
ncbi:MAG: hypothetical protein LUG18_04205 [Candidatus Azobacteroides sp.]|nr:hypothetical protein [Candidatus Azobacteroides sp.]